MIVAISYYPNDEALMRRWAAHVQKLGPYPKHEFILAVAHKASTAGIQQPLAESFGKFTLIECWHTEKGWPVSCNKSFEEIARHQMMGDRKPFLFMEPDAVPLVPDWIDRIEAEYQSCGKPFMGDFVGLKNAMEGGIDHMSGIAVYHGLSASYAPSLFNNETVAWDIVSAKDVLPNMHWTRLIHHDWEAKFGQTHQWRKENVDASFVREGAVIYHPDKRGVLFNDGLAGEGNRVQGEPETGGDVVTPSSFEHSSPAHNEIEKAVQSLKSHYNEKKTKRIVIQKLTEAGFIKAKKGKQSRKKVPTPLGRGKRLAVGAGASLPSGQEVEA
jgi:hypothetical protein